MISTDLMSIADRLAGYSLRRCALEPEIAALVVAALFDCAARVAVLEALPFAAEKPDVQ